MSHLDDLLKQAEEEMASALLKKHKGMSEERAAKRAQITIPLAARIVREQILPSRILPDEQKIKEIKFYFIEVDVSDETATAIAEQFIKESRG